MLRFGLYQVHAIYQRCGPRVNASCNCGVAVQSGDDVLVIERCFRNRVNSIRYETCCPFGRTKIKRSQPLHIFAQTANCMIAQDDVSCSFPGASDPPRDITEMRVQIYRNGDFTPGTKIHSAAEGRKYFVSTATFCAACVCETTLSHC